MRLTIAVSLFLCSPVWAECPAPPDIAGDLSALIDRANAAENDMAGREVSNEMWQLWLTAPDDAAQQVLDRGMRARSSYDYLGAIEAYDRLIIYCPDYAEGYNQRAFIYFLQQEYGLALIDLDKALALSPRHVGAQSGRALTLMNLGRRDEARAQLLEALENNPWLSERFLLADGGPLAEPGEDI
ncbi:MAG: tetratricopeptide repeat protein [Roseobacter sp.]|jgi:tetratricopeptide (TPR) repeat protein|nr:tetratricopeptide repeat protein [Roseobacter sp.]